MYILATNETEADIILTDLNGYKLEPSTQVDLAQAFVGKLYLLGSSDILTLNIANQNITINNGSEDLTPTDALQYVVLQNIISGPKDTTGRLQVYPSNRKYGLSAGWTGQDDSSGTIFDVYDGNPFYCLHAISDPTTQTFTFNFNTIQNETQLHEIIVMWSGTDGDRGSFVVCAHATEYESGSNTYYQTLSTGDPIIDSMIFPAAGDGNISVTSDLTSSFGGLVQMVEDADGITPPGYWDADFNATTGLFENIAAAPDGSGEYNLYTQELELLHMGNEIIFLGDGNIRIGSPDTRSSSHGTLLKVILKTNTDIDDHRWAVGLNLGMHRASIRKQTYS